MNEVEWLKSLDTPGAAPVVDVVPGVIQAIQSVEPDSARIYQVAAIAALLIGAVTLMIGLPALSDGPNPLDGLAESFNMVQR